MVNDPISDPPGDAMYIRDEDMGVFWTPTASPIRELDAYRARHGQGYTVFEHHSHAIEQELVTFVPVDDSGGASLRLQRLRLRNRSSRRRRLSITSYAEWVLGGNRDETQMHVVTNWDVESQSMFARNAYHPDAGNRVAFASAIPRATSYTADRAEFLGRNGSTARPAALLRESLSGRTGGGLDPCVALQVNIEIEPGAEAEVIFSSRPGRRRGASSESASALPSSPVKSRRGCGRPRRGGITCLKPSRSRPPISPSTSCSIDGCSIRRSVAGFGDDRGSINPGARSASAISCKTRWRWFTRRLSLAGNRFSWPQAASLWKAMSSIGGMRSQAPESARGYRTICCGCRTSPRQYVRVTGDAQILEEIVPFLEAPPLEAHEQERYFVPGGLTESRIVERALPPGNRPRPDGRSARIAAHRHRRLERWDEPRRRRRSGRKRLAGVVPDRRASGLRGAHRQ